MSLQKKLSLRWYNVAKTRSYYNAMNIAEFGPREYKNDSLKLFLAGAVIAGIGFVAEGKVLSEPGFNMDAVIRIFIDAAPVTIGGAGLIHFARKPGNQ